jgi:hypothetical protein
MKRKKHTQAQIIDKLRIAERLSAEGTSGADIARQLEVESSCASLVSRANILSLEKIIRRSR